MRRFFLFAATVLAALTLQAQTWTTPATWTKSLTPVNDAEQLGGTHTSVADDGSVLTTGTYNQTTKFGTTTLTNDDQMTSAYIAKYNADGTEAWAVGLYGSAIIRTIDTDTEGNVYVAGNLADKVVFNSLDDKKQEVSGMENMETPTTGFIAKYDKSGNLKAVRTVIPTANKEMTANPSYMAGIIDLNFTPNKIQVSGSKVYLSARYTGDVTIDAMSWKGSYYTAWGVYVLEAPAVGILAVDASDLSNATNVANLYMKENLSEIMSAPESVRFTVDGSTVYAGFVGKGNETLTTPNSNTDLTMVYPTDGSSNVEHAFILAKIDAGSTTVKTFNVEAHDKDYLTDVVGDMQLVGGKLYVGGTFYGELGFDKTKKSTGSSDLFLASINPADLSVNWAVNDGYDEGDVTKNEERFRAMVIGADKAFIAGVAQQKVGSVTNAVTYNVSLDGTLSNGDNVEYASINDNGRGKLATITNSEATTTVSLFESATAVETITTKATAASNDNVYTLSGQLVGKNQKLDKGIYIIGGKKVVVK